MFAATGSTTTPMPQLAWNDLDFLECLGVEPEVLDYLVSHNYTLVRNGLRLLITVWQFESVIQFSMFRESAEVPFCSFACFVRGRVRHVDDQRGDFLEMQDCIIGPNRFWYMSAGDPFDPKRFPVGVNLQVSVVPDIQINIVEPA
jgi:hypothetical protein